MIQCQKLDPRNSPHQGTRREKPYGSLRGGGRVRIKLDASTGFQGLGTSLRQPAGTRRECPQLDTSCVSEALLCSELNKETKDVSVPLR